MAYETAFAVLDVITEEDALGPFTRVDKPSGVHTAVPSGDVSGGKGLFLIACESGSLPVGSWPTFTDIPSSTRSTYNAFNPGVIAGLEG